MKAEAVSKEAEDYRSNSSRWLKTLCVCAPFLLVFIFYPFFKGSVDFSLFPFFITFSAVSLILAAIYFHTFKFFKDDFYFFVACFWLSNGVYVFPQVAVRDFTFRTSGISSIWNLTSYSFLFLALLSRGIRKPPRTTLVALGITALGSIGVGLLIAFAETSIIDIRLLVTLSLSAMGSYLLCRVGEVLSDRLWGPKITSTRYILLSTFYAYAFLQFYDALVFYRHILETILLLPFLIALIAKVGNAVAMQGALQFVIATNAAKVQYEMDVALANLRTREAELQRKSQFVELGALAASIKHDIQTPLATMSLNIRSLENALQHDSRLTRKLEDLVASMDRIHAIVGIVDIIRLDRTFFDRQQFMVKVSLLEIAHRAVRWIKNEISELKNPFPRTRIRIEGRDVWVRAYPPMFEQVLVNVIKNGIEAIDEAGRESGLIIIRVSRTTLPTEQSRPCAKVEIEDNGVGIPEEHADQLGFVFSTKAHKKPNSGIGLFIGIRIVNIHNGRMTFESKVGEGTKVTIVLPTFQVAQEDAATS